MERARRKSGYRIPKGSKPVPQAKVPLFSPGVKSAADWHNPEQRDPSLRCLLLKIDKLQSYASHFHESLIFRGVFGTLNKPLWTTPAEIVSGDLPPKSRPGQSVQSDQTHHRYHVIGPDVSPHGASGRFRVLTGPCRLGVFHLRRPIPGVVPLHSHPGNRTGRYLSSARICLGLHCRTSVPPLESVRLALGMGTVEGTARDPSSCRRDRHAALLLS